MGDPLAAPALGLKISLALMRRLFVERGFLSWISFIRLSSFGPEFIGLTFHFRQTRVMIRLLILACRFLLPLSLLVIGDTQVSAKEKDKTAQVGPGQDGDNGCH